MHRVSTKSWRRASIGLGGKMHGVIVAKVLSALSINFVPNFVFDESNRATATLSQLHRQR